MYKADRREREYFTGVASFMRAAAVYKANNLIGYIHCPCVDCKNEKEFLMLRKSVHTCSEGVSSLCIIGGRSTVKMRLFNMRQTVSRRRYKIRSWTPMKIHLLTTTKITKMI